MGQDQWRKLYEHEERKCTGAEDHAKTTRTAAHENNDVSNRHEKLLIPATGVQRMWKGRPTPRNEARVNTYNIMIYSPQLQTLFNMCEPAKPGWPEGRQQ